MNASLNQPTAWPEALLPVFEQAITTEYASINRRGAPLTYPVNPDLAEEGRTLDVSTGLTYPSKAERARSNPKVALLFSDPVGMHLHQPPVVLVQGMAAVRDADLQANTDQYIRQSFKKFSQTYTAMPPFLLKRQQWYFTRIWIQVTPLHILWWPEGNLERQPECWDAPQDLPIPASDPAPQGKIPGAWTKGPQDWQTGAAYALQRMGTPILTVVDGQGFPLPMRVRTAAITSTGFHADLPAGLPANSKGPACLTFHTHPEQFTYQENMVFTGTVEPDGSFTVERQIGDFSFSKSKLKSLWVFMSNGRKLAPRLSEELRRRRQTAPIIHLP